MKMKRTAAVLVLVTGLGDQLARAQNSASPQGEAPRDVIQGVLQDAPTIAAVRASRDCVPLPAPPADERLLGPHGDSLISTRCEVLSYEVLDGARPMAWSTARYRWTSVFTAEDKTRGPAARDNATEEEIVLFDAQDPAKLRPVWHDRFDAGEYGAWRSITPELVRTGERTVLLGVRYCVNGTGGCSQEFLHRDAAGHWTEVKQAWLDQLPAGYRGRIRHGFDINVRTMKGEAGFYGDADANCCPSEVLKFEVAVRGDSLVLTAQRAEPAPRRTR